MHPVRIGPEERRQGGRGGREGEEREKGKRLGGPRLGPAQSTLTGFRPHPQQRPRGPRGPQRSPHAVQRARGRRVAPASLRPGSAARVGSTGQGGHTGDSLFVFGLSAALPPERPVRLSILCKHSVQVRTGLKPRWKRRMVSPRQARPRTQRGGPTAHSWPPPSHCWLTALSVGQGTTRKGQTRGGGSCTPRTRPAWGHAGRLRGGAAVALTGHTSSLRSSKGSDEGCMLRRALQA